MDVLGKLPDDKGGEGGITEDIPGFRPERRWPAEPGGVDNW